MMNKIANILFVVLALCLSSCQNDGDIGDWFGTWRVDEYAVDGVAQKGLPENTTFSFQSDVVYVVVLVDEHQTDYERYGTWSEQGNAFTLNFTHSDNNTPAGTDIYAAPEWLGMTSADPMSMTLDKHNSRSVTLRWTSPDGAVRTYKLNKTW